MMRSMFSGVSGLKAHQAKMDVIGNNIANVNTVGFKGQTVTFQEVFSQTIRGAGAPQSGRGGTNPQSIGLGVNVASMDVIHTQGSTQRTDNPTDIMIDGNGFFVVSNDANGLNRYYTRAGNFSVDELGNLVTPGGFKVLDKDGAAVQIDKTTTAPATATGPAVWPTVPATADTEQIWVLSGNISATDNGVSGQLYDTKPVFSTTISVYDSLGRVQKLNVNFGEATAAAGGGLKRQFNITQTDTSVTPSVVQNLYGGSLDAVGATSAFVEFDTTGVFSSLMLGNPAAAVAANQFVTVTPGMTAGASALVLPLTESVAGQSNLFSSMTQNNALSDVTGVAKKGNAPGSIDSFNISSSGEVVATFTNGDRQTLATIGLATFDNPAGLQKMGANMFVDTPNSGDPRLGTPGVGSFGALVPGALEMSNVDLSQQFTEMITTQRGFQANSRVITTTDEMLQELVNLKR